MSTSAEPLLNDEIKEMIHKLARLNRLPHDDIASWETGYPNYHSEVLSFFRQINEFWNDYHYVKNSENLNIAQINTFDLAQIKSILTKLNRQERFSEGSWQQSIQSGVFVEIQQRLTQLLDTK